MMFRYIEQVHTIPGTSKQQLLAVMDPCATDVRILTIAKYGSCCQKTVQPAQEGLRVPEK